MGRFRSRVEPVRKRTLPKKQDTPLKSTLSRGILLKRQMGNKVYEALPEDAEVAHISIPPVKTTQPLMEKDSPKLCQTEADKGAESSESGTTPSLVIDTSCSSGDDNDSLLLDSSSSLSSPEVFREEHYVERFTFPLDDDLTDLHLPIKNSTLLDLSHAETILMHQPPNLSTIMDAPTILAENSPHNIGTNTRPADGCKVAEDSNLENKKCKPKQTPACVIFKKRVCFRSPLFSEKSRRENVAAPKLSGDTISKQVTPPSPHESIEPDTETIKKEENEVDGGIFFDFASDAEWENLFQKMRERCAKLKKAALFPLTAVRPKKSAVL